MEYLVLFGVAALVLAVGIRVGMLLAPRIERMADRAAREDVTDAGGAAVQIEPDHEDDDDGTD